VKLVINLIIQGRGEGCLLMRTVDLIVSATSTPHPDPLPSKTRGEGVKHDATLDESATPKSVSEGRSHAS
jgi:hypothetical protein